MASGSAFQYSTLATLGHPTSSVPLPPLPLRLPSSCSSASSMFLSFLYPRLILLRSLIALSFFLSFHLSTFLLLPFRPARLFLSFRSSSSFSAAISSLSDRSSASSFGLKVLLFRSSAFLSFRSLADSSDELSSLRRHCGRIHSADFIEHIFLSFFLPPFSFLFFADSPRPLMDLSILRLLFFIKLGD